MTTIDPVTVVLVLILAAIVGYFARRVVDALDDLRALQRQTNNLLADLTEREQHERAVDLAVDRAHAAAAAAGDRLYARVNQPTNQPTNRAAIR